MKKEKISDILENISTKYIDEAALYPENTDGAAFYPQKKKLRFSAVKWGAAAACLVVLIVGGAVVLPSVRRANTEVGEPESAVNTTSPENLIGSGDTELVTENNITDTTAGSGGAAESGINDIGDDTAKPTYETTSDNTPTCSNAEQENTTEASTGETTAGSGGEIMPGGATIGDEIAYEPIDEPTSEDTAVASTAPDYPAMVMIDGKLYVEGGIAFMTTEEIVPDGQIVSSCNGEPTENGQSNFGSGYYYQIGRNGTLNVRFDDGWHVFTYLVSDEDADSDISVPPYEASTPAYDPSANTPAHAPSRNTPAYDPSTNITGC